MYRSLSFRPAVLFVAVMIVLILESCGGATITPKGAAVESTLFLEDVYEFRVADIPGGSYAVVRAAPDGYGQVVEGYNERLTLAWRHLIPYTRHRENHPLWLVGSAAGVMLIHDRDEEDDSLSIHGMVFDPGDGTVRSDRFLTGFTSGVESERFSAPRLVYSPDSSRFVIYRYDYGKLADDGRRKIRLLAELFDIGLSYRGGGVIEIPVHDRIDDAEDAENFVQTFFVANDGHAYQVSYHGKSTMRVTQLDFSTGATRMLEQEIPTFNLLEESNWFYETTKWTGSGQELIVAATRVKYGELLGVALVGMDFGRNQVEYVNLVQVTEPLARRLIDEKELRGFWLRDIIRTADGVTILPLEQKSTFTDKNGFAGRNEYYVHEDVLILGFDSHGKSLWMSAQNRPEARTTLTDYRSDSWRIDGDSVRFIYQDEDLDGLAAGAISIRNGSFSTPRLLIETSMDVEYRFTKWLGRNNALIVLSSGQDFRLVRFHY